jgi:hypothetical protein
MATAAITTATVPAPIAAAAGDETAAKRSWMNRDARADREVVPPGAGSASTTAGASNAPDAEARGLDAPGMSSGARLDDGRISIVGRSMLGSGTPEPAFAARPDRDRDRVVRVARPAVRPAGARR